MPNPLTAAFNWAKADASANLPAGTTVSTSFPSSAITVPHVQVAWDGTPSDADNREDAAIRFTIWAPTGKPTLAQDLAGGVRARFLAFASADIQRVNRGAGRLPGTDDATKLPFCTFTCNPVMRALA